MGWRVIFRHRERTACAWRSSIFWIASAAFSLLAMTANAAPSHCITLYGACKYAADFSHFEYVSPDAPKGGSIKMAETGSFDSVNPFILKGVKAPGVGMAFESLMTSSFDEPQTMYGLIAESVDIAPDRSHADFMLRPIAKWHDGTAITADDVVFSFDTLKGKGDPTL
ncbi:MAG: hypothetical protein EBR02_08640 [Alphaproteobacteria bacterium]|nr:hypothetical protein [Alphaproteobacteria bacterium]